MPVGKKDMDEANKMADKLKEEKEKTDAKEKGEKEKRDAKERQIKRKGYGSRISKMRRINYKRSWTKKGKHHEKRERHEKA